MRSALALLLIAAGAFAGTVSVSDSTFTSGWTTQVIYSTDSDHAASGNQSAAGGNPGAYYVVHHSYNGDIAVANLSSLSLDPSLVGGFSSLAYSYDYLKIQPS